MASRKAPGTRRTPRPPSPPSPVRGRAPRRPGSPCPPRAKPRPRHHPLRNRRESPPTRTPKPPTARPSKSCRTRPPRTARSPPPQRPQARAPNSKGSAKTGTSGEEHDKKLAEGLRALDAVTARYARDGATKDEIETGVKSVRRKFTVFKSIEVVDGGDTWDYEYVANPGTKKGAKQSTVKGASGPNQKVLGITTSPEITDRHGNLARGDRGALTANLGGPEDNHAAHHLIPVSTASEALLMKAGAESGYDINRASNGVMLPTDPAIAKKLKKPLHKGGHLGEYFDTVRAMLAAQEQAARRAHAASKPWSEVKLLGAIGRVESTLKRRLLDLKDPLKLQSMDPLKKP